VLGHFAPLGAATFPAAAGLFAGPVVRYGWSGVDLFFVLSGLLIGRQLWREYARTGGVDAWAFVLRRGFRIWPLYFAAALVSPFFSGRWTFAWSDWAFLSNYVHGHVSGGWSLSTEEQFYVVAPLLLVLGRRALTPRRWLTVLPLLLVGVEAARWATAQRLLGAGVPVLEAKRLMYYPFHLHNEGLVVGLAIALVSVLAPTWLAGDPRFRGRTAVAVGAALAAAAALYRVSDVVFPFLALALVYGAAVVGLLGFGLARSAPVRPRVFYTISRLSFGMYLNHFAVLRWLAPPLARLARAGGRPRVRRRGARPRAHGRLLGGARRRHVRPHRAAVPRDARARAATPRQHAGRRARGRRQDRRDGAAGRLSARAPRAGA
jgi:peptidoglycan/LPS O-acetylase OafA/YrhL